ncbi:D-alanyl-D-alanine carboxypeptidase family protein [Actinomadura roseirufa]|uniref:D-alanyl-D-alanine carboxypeptidase family protein n=1 Tax=Actinomadura roseirufa TaxID=2094049 RepID=UPI0010414D11|nr:D-alanyl-D-alanine carboxypeptidase [Actinomadura roseirufa]
MSSFRPWHVAAFVFAVALAVIVAARTLAPGGATASGPRWPSEGQAAAEAEGLGALGTKGEQRPVPIASLTKVMTAYVILRDHPLRDGRPGPMITVDAAAAGEASLRDQSAVYVGEGQEFDQRRMLEMMLIPSGNNIARLLARWDAGGERAFVAKMNREAARLGMSRTTYTGASGYEDSTVSTATDQLKLAKAAMRDPVIRSIVARPSVTVPGVGPIVNTNTLLEKPDVIGLKTGSSSRAGGALMWAARTGDGKRMLMGVVLQQNVGARPERGLRSALSAGRRLIDSIQALADRAG